MANVNIRVDDALKKEAERIFSELGLSMSTATNVFYRQVVQYGGIPFELRVNDPFYSAENQARLQKSIEDYEAGKSVDPFYSENNIRYLEQKIADYKAGKLKFAEHELIEDE